MQRFFLYPVMILLIATKFRNKNHFQNMNKEQKISKDIKSIKTILCVSDNGALVILLVAKFICTQMKVGLQYKEYKNLNFTV